MRLELTRSIIRPLVTDDAPSIARHANNRAVWLNMRDLLPHPYTLADAEEFLAHATRCHPPTSFAIEVDGAAAGVIGVRLKTDVDRTGAEMGYWLGEQFWGRGIMSEVIPAFTRWALAEFQLTRLEALVFEWNPASAKVLERAGYQLEGILRKSAIKDARLIDRMMYAFVVE